MSSQHSIAPYPPDHNPAEDAPTPPPHPSLDTVLERFRKYRVPERYQEHVATSLRLVRDQAQAEISASTVSSRTADLRHKYRKMGTEAGVLAGIYELEITGELWENSFTAQRLWPDPNSILGRKEWFVLLTTRSAKMKSHPGDAAFPGGGRDPQDASIEHTARREAWEEVGLPLRSQQVEILGRLPSIISRDYSEVFPIAALIPKPLLPQDLRRSGRDPHGRDDPVFIAKPSFSEVEFIFSAPLRLFNQVHPDWYENFVSKWMAGRYRIHSFLWDCPPCLYAHQSAWASPGAASSSGAAAAAAAADTPPNSPSLRPSAPQTPPETSREFQIYGLTGWALIQLAKVVYDRKPKFPGDLILSVGDRPVLENGHLGERDDARLRKSQEMKSRRRDGRTLPSRL